MSADLTILLSLAASLGFMHTLLGPDHYLPFIVISKARQWNLGKTACITFLCGLGHVSSSVLLGLAGITLGIAVAKLEFIEAVRGELAAWLLICFGFLYFVWGVRAAIKNKEHSHLHFHANGSMHKHTHQHKKEHTHPHVKSYKELTPWILFTIFVFGPCEPLIPILMYPAAKGSTMGAVLVALVFSVVTIATMMTIVIASVYGSTLIKIKYLQRFGHALAGAVICLSGLAIKFLGL